MSDDAKNLKPSEEKKEDAPSVEEMSPEEQPLETSGESKQVLENLEDLEGLEVAAMPESNELQERRRKTKNRLQELSNLEDSAELAENEIFDEESGLMDLLKEARLSSRGVKFCCSGILLMAVLVGLFFGGKALWGWWSAREPVEEDPNGEVEEEPEEEPTGEYSFLDPSLIGGLLVGMDEPEPDSSTEAGEDLGDNADRSDELSAAIVDFSLLYEILQVDVNELLNQSSDRSGTLADHLNELRYLQHVAEGTVESLEESSAGLVQKFNAVEDEKAEQEALFFSELQDLDAPAAVSALNAFIAQGEDSVRLRAEYSARQKLVSYFEQALDVLILRIRDIELNEEALVKGVQVVEVEGSTLNLILDENDL